MRKTWILMGIAMLLLTTYQVVTTYAKYTTEAIATAQKQAGAWIVKVNNSNICNGGQQATFNIDKLTYPSVVNVKPNKMAPSSTGYFDIVIDPTGSSVAVRFDVTLAVENLNLLDSIKFSSACRVVNGVEDSTGIVNTATNTYSGIINLSDVKNSVSSTVRFYLEWEEKGTAAGDAADSELGATYGVGAALPVNVVVSQYTGETLVAIE